MPTMSMTANTLELLKKHRLKRKLMRNVSVRTVLMSDHYDSLDEDWGRASVTVMERLVEADKSASKSTSKKDSGKPSSSPSRRSSSSSEAELPSPSAAEKRPAYSKSQSAGAILEHEGDKFHSPVSPTRSPRKVNKSTPPRLAPCATDFSPSRRSPRSPARRSRDLTGKELPKTILFQEEESPEATPMEVEDTVKLAFSNEENLAPEKRSFNGESGRAGIVRTDGGKTEDKPTPMEVDDSFHLSVLEQLTLEAEQLLARSAAPLVDGTGVAKPDSRVDEVRAASPDSVATPLSVDPAPSLEEDMGVIDTSEVCGNRFVPDVSRVHNSPSRQVTVVDVPPSPSRAVVNAATEIRKMSSSTGASPSLRKEFDAGDGNSPSRHMTTSGMVDAPPSPARAVVNAATETRKMSFSTRAAPSLRKEYDVGGVNEAVGVRGVSKPSPGHTAASASTTLAMVKAAAESHKLSSSTRASPSMRKPFDAGVVKQAVGVPKPSSGNRVDAGVMKKAVGVSKPSSGNSARAPAPLLSRSGAFDAEDDPIVASAGRVLAATKTVFDVDEAPQDPGLAKKEPLQSSARRVVPAAPPRSPLNPTFDHDEAPHLVSDKVTSPARPAPSSSRGMFDADEVPQAPSDLLAALTDWAAAPDNKMARKQAKRAVEAHKARLLADAIKARKEAESIKARKEAASRQQSAAVNKAKMDDIKTQQLDVTKVKKEATDKARRESEEKARKVAEAAENAKKEASTKKAKDLLEWAREARAKAKARETKRLEKEKAAAAEKVALEASANPAPVAPAEKATPQASANPAPVAPAEKATLKAANPALAEVAPRAEAPPEEQTTQASSTEMDVTPSPPEAKGQKKKKGRRIRFADEVGQPLHETRYAVTQYSEEDLQTLRTIVLLMSPKHRKFEFIHLSYGMDEKTIVGDIIGQIPAFATDSTLSKQKYVGLCRPKESGRELINTVSIQGYFLARDEVLVAVAKEYSAKALLKMAKPLLENKKILRAVKKAKANGLAVQRLKPSNTGPKNQPMEKRRKELEKKEATAFNKKIKIAPEPNRSGSPRRRRNSHINLDDIDDHEMPNMDMSHMDSSNFMEEDTNKDKMVVTRFLNAGIFAAFAFALGGKSKQPAYAH